MAKADKRLAADRLRVLIRQLGRERGHDTGWKTEVAAEIGIGGSLLSKLSADPTRSVSTETIQRAIDRLGIDPRFFYDRKLGAEPNYHDFQDGAQSTSDAAEPPFWAEFLRNYDRIALLSESDLDRIKRNWTPDIEIASWRDWAQLANWYLDRRPIQR